MATPARLFLLRAAAVAAAAMTGLPGCALEFHLVGDGPDASTPDAGPADAGDSDAGPLDAGPGDAGAPDAEAVLLWNTFLGGSSTDFGSIVVLDPNGNVYAGGMSQATWGAPRRPFGDGNWDAFVAKLDAQGNLLWNTFLGAPSAAADTCTAIAVHESGDVYVAGRSTEPWDTPVRTFSSGADVFVAKLSANGDLVWHTFLGGSGSDDEAKGIAVDQNGSVVVVATSDASWGAPVRPHSGGADVFAARLAPDGTLLWSTFYGGSGDDRANGFTADLLGGFAYVSGLSTSTWGAPLSGFTGIMDALLLKLDLASGALLWHTFLGGDQDDEGRGVAVAPDGGALLSGYSMATWGTPLRAYTAGRDAFVARLDSTGNLVWNTFLGGALDDVADGIAIGNGGDLFVSGYGEANWGTPLRPYVGGRSDILLARLDLQGGLLWNAFFGGDGGTAYDDDYGNSATSDAAGFIFVAGDSETSWGTPRRAHSGTHDVFVAKVR